MKALKRLINMNKIFVMVALVSTVGFVACETSSVKEDNIEAKAEVKINLLSFLFKTFTEIDINISLWFPVTIRAVFLFILKVNVKVYKKMSFKCKVK